MLKLTFDQASSYSLLAIGRHPNDIEIGCGGLILHLIDSLPSVEVSWAVDFTEDLFRADLGLRGMESNSPSRNAEAFHGREVVL